MNVEPVPRVEHPARVPSDAFRRLVALADAYQAAHGLSDGQMADRAGLMRESYLRACKKGRDGKGDVETMTMQKIAAAIGLEVTLAPKGGAS
jgi:hypothetical protein